MKIECTEKEKGLIIDALTNNDTDCIFIDGVCYGFGHCKKCLEDRIEWVITD